MSLQLKDRKRFTKFFIRPYLRTLFFDSNLHFFTFGLSYCFFFRIRFPRRFRFFQVNFITDFFHICGLCCEDGQLPSFVAMKDNGRTICGFSCILEPLPNIFTMSS